MQMLDVLKRLAELDEQNPQVYKDTPVLNNESKDVDEEKADEGPEILKIKSDQAKAKGEKSFNVGNKTFPVKEGDDEQVEECGMMPSMGGMGEHHTPASINISADSGDELSAMLRDIMTLAGRGQPDMDVTPDMPGQTPPPAEVDTDGGDMDSDGTNIMRSMIDKLHPGDDSEGDVDNKDDMKEYDNTPADPNDKNQFDANKFAHQENQPGQGDRMDGTQPKAYPTKEELENSLFLEYKRFISEN